MTAGEAPGEIGMGSGMWRPHRRQPAPEFGARVRTLRSGKGFGLREFARKVDISPTYLSQVERGEVPPPAEARVVVIAQALEQDPAELLALAGRIPHNIRAALMRHPAEMTALIAAGARLTREELLELVLVASKFPLTEGGKGGG